MPETQLHVSFCSAVSALFCTSNESLRDWCCRKLADVLRVAIAEGKLVSPSHNQVYVVCCVLLNKRDLLLVPHQVTRCVSLLCAGPDCK